MPAPCRSLPAGRDLLSPVHRQQPFPVALSGRIRSSRFRRHSVHLGLAGGGRRPGRGPAARAAYDSYWGERSGALAPGGVDVFARTATPSLTETAPSGSPDHNEQFYTAPEDQLNIGIYYQTRVWLEDFTRSGHNPWNAHNASASWQISPSPRRTGPIQGGTTWRRPPTTCWPGRTQTVTSTWLPASGTAPKRDASLSSRAGPWALIRR